MCFGTRKRLEKFKSLKIILLNEYIKHVPSYKYLGVILDAGLSFKLQIQATMNKILLKMYILSKVRTYLSEKSAILIYKSMLLPYFDYGDIIYMFSSKNDLVKLERLQERCIKIDTKTNGKINMKQIRNTNKLPTLEKRRKCHLNNFMFKNKNNIETIDEDNDDLIMTRSMTSKKFIVKKNNLEAYKRSIGYSRGNMWNMLPNNTKNKNDMSYYITYKYKDLYLNLHPSKFIQKLSNQMYVLS